MNGLEPKVLANKCAKISNKLLIALRDLFWNYHCYLFLCCVYVCIFNGPNFRKVAVNGNAGLGVNFWGAGGPWVAGAQVGVVPNVAYPFDRLCSLTFFYSPRPACFSVIPLSNLDIV